MKMIFIFIDGLGIGADKKEGNPLIAADTPHLDAILNGDNVFPTDACLGIGGLPQSATGQTTIFTGVNASEVLGRHLHGQPTVTLKKIIDHNNLFKELMKRGFKVTNANVYRQQYLDNLEDGKDRRLRPSVTTVMSLSAGMELRTVEQYKKGAGVYHDITGQVLVESGYDAQTITPQQAAQRLYNISREYDFTLFEHFMSDIIGHKMDMPLAVKEIGLLDEFLGALVGMVDLDEDIIMITSDHGNIEDVTVKTHTFNKVPTVVLGKIPEKGTLKIESLTDMMPAVLQIFEQRRSKWVEK